MLTRVRNAFLGVATLLVVAVVAVVATGGWGFFGGAGEFPDPRAGWTDRGDHRLTLTVTHADVTQAQVDDGHVITASFRVTNHTPGWVGPFVLGNGEWHVRLRGYDGHSTVDLRVYQRPGWWVSATCDIEVDDVVVDGPRSWPAERDGERRSVSCLWSPLTHGKPGG